MAQEKVKYGIIQISYRYAIDGEYCSGYSEYDVEVTEYWGNSHIYKDQPKEVKELTDGNGLEQYYRQTLKNGWRKYNKLRTPKYEENRYIGQKISFVPNKKANYEKNYSNISLGHSH